RGGSVVVDPRLLAVIALGFVSVAGARGRRWVAWSIRSVHALGERRRLIAGLAAICSRIKQLLARSFDLRLKDPGLGGRAVASETILSHRATIERRFLRLALAPVLAVSRAVRRAAK